MKNLFKSLRHHYWLISSFIKKNATFVFVSAIVSFFLILLSVNSLPFVNTLLSQKKEKIGMIGRFTLQDVPPEITTLVSSGLLTTDEKGGLVPVLASTWELSDDKKTYRIHLKSDLLWSDSKAFIAQDIPYTFPGIEKKAIDDKTIIFTLSEPLSTFPLYITKPILRQPLKGIGGLYQVESIRYSKNKFIKELNLVPQQNNVPYKIYRFYDTEDELISAYKKGDITQFTTSKKTITDIFENWKNTKIDKTVNTNQILTLFFNTQKEPLSSKDVRKAISFAIPQFENQGVVASGPIPPLSWAHNPDLKKYTYDKEKAQALLEKNIDASDSAELELFTFYDYLSNAESIKKELEASGLKVKIRVRSYMPQEFDMLLTLWNPPIDPDQYYFWHSTQKNDNLTRYRNVKVDLLLEEGRRITNRDERKKKYMEFQETLVDDVPAHFIYYPYIYTVKRK